MRRYKYLFLGSHNFVIVALGPEGSYLNQRLQEISLALTSLHLISELLYLPVGRHPPYLVALRLTFLPTAFRSSYYCGNYIIWAVRVRLYPLCSCGYKYLRLQLLGGVANKENRGLPMFDRTCSSCRSTLNAILHNSSRVSKRPGPAGLHEAGPDLR